MASQEQLLPARYTHVRDLGQGNFGVAKLVMDTSTNELVAIKLIPRGSKIDRNVEREIVNHWSLNHPNIVAFREVFLTHSHLAIVMEYAAGGELFERIVKAGRFSEDEARYFFQQLISGVDHCHRSGVCHRDLKLENTLLDNNAAPRLKICDFGYSKSALDSQPKSTVGTPAYIAPEVLQRREYSGQAADVWSCGVTLYVMLAGAYPFEDPADPRNFRKTIQRIMSVTWALPPDLGVSVEVRDLLGRIFVGAPQQRITLEQIRQHPWFRRNLPAELADPDQYVRAPDPRQSLEDIRGLIQAARQRPDTPPAPAPDEMDGDGDTSMADDLADTSTSSSTRRPGQGHGQAQADLRMPTSGLQPHAQATQATHMSAAGPPAYLRVQPQQQQQVPQVVYAVQAGGRPGVAAQQPLLVQQPHGMVFGVHGLQQQQQQYIAQSPAQAGGMTPAGLGHPMPVLPLQLYPQLLQSQGHGAGARPQHVAVMYTQPVGTTLQQHTQHTRHAAHTAHAGGSTPVLAPFMQRAHLDNAQQQQQQQQQQGTGRAPPG